MIGSEGVSTFFKTFFCSIIYVYCPFFSSDHMRLEDTFTYIASLVVNGERILTYASLFLCSTTTNFFTEKIEAVINIYFFLKKN